MPTESYFVLGPKGSERWDVNRIPININPTLSDALSQGVSRKAPALANIGGHYGNAGAAVLGNYEFWSVRVLTLALNAPFRLADGIHTPAFTIKTEPVMNMVWKVPSTMALTLGINVLRDGRRFYAGEHYLVAMTSDFRMWRLPLSNLYEDCKLCHGQEIDYCNTSLESVNKCCAKFSKSQWNQDLFSGDDTRDKASRSMFRFKPLEKGFEQLAMELRTGKDWTSLCQKVSVDKLQNLIQIT